MKQPNVLADLLLTVVLPSMVLDHLSDASRLGPVGALIVSLMFPVGFAAWCLWKKCGWDVISILGFITILLSGGLGLLKLPALWFAVKESALPLALGAAFPLSLAFGRPLLSALLLRPQLINLPALNAALSATGKRGEFHRALFRGSWSIGLATIGLSIGNFFLAMHLLGGKEPGSEAFVKGIGTLNWASLLVIGGPLTAVMIVIFLWLTREIQRITGLERADLMNPGRTVRRQIGKM